jgi:hypothetical protein
MEWMKGKRVDEIVANPLHGMDEGESDLEISTESPS